MARDPLAAVSAIATPQSQPIPGRTGQMRNAAGGYVFAKDLWTRLEDFLILGTTGGTYYVGEDKLTAQNAGVLFQAIAEDGPRVVRLLTEISTARPPRAPKQRPALFALAAAYAEGDADTRQAAKVALAKVARTTDHLAQFFGYYKNLGGKPTARGIAPTAGRSLRTALGSWFLTGTADDVAFKACKARQRKTPLGESFDLRDALRIAHPAADDEQRRTLFGWIAGNVGDDRAREVLPAVDRFLTAKAVTTPAEAIEVVTTAKVPWEFLPDSVLKDPSVWEALIETIGMTALIRNLARMTRLGTLKPMGAATSRAVRRLTNREAIVRARIHPMDAWLAMRVYKSGVAQPNPRAARQTWHPVPEILDALEGTYEAAFGTVEPSGKRLLVAVDSSGSMSWGGGVRVGGSPIGSPYEVGNAMAVMLARIERGNVHVIDVDTSVHASKVTPRTNLRELASWRPSGGGTDLSLPFTWAREQRMEVDGIVVFTDNETWAGRSHPTQALDAYRRGVNPDARVVVAAMTAAGYSIGDTKDEGVLNVAGLDASLPLVVNGFVR
ncbi:TROVE domain-containing protein [Nonomuraea gerenzanensis]|uniref:60 kDa SS-A/Ro ribonucleoprotein homolog (Ro sixty-related protein) n=1 Tax=Nonomuraea gerenzanensis TaxID=93944 RepID=A0A1M4EKD4_9ACTN|nr:TROVE domain-containing protein [Nonomuraea gerenzanensis]UBU10893.1 TROVE domain-containing protein [Nonomuraea gerenzanensis]SBO99332.1 60 kDa SS-A/Ro ribonucleoprotein homolog (Ro sixty-related protein) [Nonomuraea gerenzanensis]